MYQSSNELRNNALKRLSQWLQPSHSRLKYAPIVSDSKGVYNYTSYDPATGKPLVCFKKTSETEINELVIKSSKAQEKWMNISLLERVKILNKVAELVRAESTWLAELETLDTGKPLWEAKNDINDCANALELFASFIPTITGVHVPIPPNPGSFYYTRREPFGVCGGIGAWNYPFQMAVWKSAPALAAGNAFVFKPSPLTPLTAVRLSELFTQAGCPENLFTVVLGDAEVGQSLINHPLIAKISFTGSVGGGKAVLHAASKRIIPGTVELGGKSSLIIMPDADLDEAVKGTLMANFYTQGQVCSNASRVFVNKSVFDVFKHKLVEATQNLKIGDPFDEKTSMGALISPSHLNNVSDYIESAISEGARKLFGGERPEFSVNDYLKNGNFLTPCILSNCHDQMKAVKEEIFGPVITLLEFESEDEVINRSNQSELGLAGGVFTQSLTTAHRIASKLQCGTVYVNTYNVFPPGIPFGGFKQSGFGRENSIETLYAYSQIKAVYVEGEKLPKPFP